MVVKSRYLVVGYGISDNGEEYSKLLEIKEGNDRETGHAYGYLGKGATYAQEILPIGEVMESSAQFTPTVVSKPDKFPMVED